MASSVIRSNVSDRRTNGMAVEQHSEGESYKRYTLQTWPPEWSGQMCRIGEQRAWRWNSILKGKVVHVIYYKHGRHCDQIECVWQENKGHGGGTAFWRGKLYMLYTTNMVSSVIRSNVSDRRTNGMAVEQHSEEESYTCTYYTLQTWSPVWSDRMCLTGVQTAWRWNNILKGKVIHLINYEHGLQCDQIKCVG